MREIKERMCLRSRKKNNESKKEKKILVDKKYGNKVSDNVLKKIKR